MLRLLVVPRLLLVVVVLVAGAILYACSQVPVYEESLPLATGNPTLSFERDVAPILNQKCIACHGCYDAPCQLKLTSAEGVERGASKLPVYDGARLKDQAPTRLGVDAQSVAEWRKKGFFSVLSAETLTNESQRTVASLLYRMVKLGHQSPVRPNERLPDSIPLGVDRPNQCPTLDEINDYAANKPLQGMPLGVTGLTNQEMTTLTTWVREGGRVDVTPLHLSQQEQADVYAWEDFLNQNGDREQLVSRYIFEHLFIAHLYFSDHDSHRFFRLVRSTTPSGEPVVPVTSVRPNDPVAGAFYYRLQPIEEALVYKTHITYSLSEKKLTHIRQLFLDSAWQVTRLPDYGAKQSSNPFATFADIPAEARYQFMLDNAEYFVRTFIRGPVCRGQIATDVINDQFWTLFQAPKRDLYVTDATYRDKVTPLLGLPGQDADLLALGPEFISYLRMRNDYEKARANEYANGQPKGASLDDLWNGDGDNRDAMLTIFRHHDSASVTRGLLGAVPETIWVMDYPLFERTYYALVVNFNVFGSVSHQAQTRLYFDLIREGAEGSFLRFLPADQRNPIRQHWYRGSGKIKLFLAYEDVDDKTPTQLHYRGDHPISQFAEQVLDHLKAVSGPPDSINRCKSSPCQSPARTATQESIDSLLAPLTGKEAQDLRVIDFLPDVTFLRVRHPDGHRDVYSVIRNRAHTNVAFMVGEDARLEPEHDTLTILPGIIGSYPNFIFDVPAGEMGDFVTQLSASQSLQAFTDVVKHWGVRRTHPDFWNVFHDFTTYLQETDPVQAGVFDLNRYANF